MNIIMYEFKKVWNWRILAVIGVMGVLVWFALLSEFLKSYDSLTIHGIYGVYQNEMFELYGDTIDPEELMAYDIPGKKAEVIRELDDMISAESIFKENQISDYEAYVMFLENISHDVGEGDEKDILETLTMMQEKLHNNAQTLEELYTSPLDKLYALTTLEGTYMNDKEFLQNRYIDGEHRPVVVQAAQNLLEKRNNNLIRYDLTSSFSNYVAGIGVFSVVSMIIFIAPFLTADRMWGVHFIQYSSKLGRKIFRIQFFVTIISTFILSALLIVLAYIPFMVNGGADYWNASVMAFHPVPGGLQLYDITFGQYACILAGIVMLFNLFVASFTFILARFSQNIIVMMMKAVPFSLATAAMLVISINFAFSESNIIFNVLFSGKIRAAELITSTLIAMVGLLAVSYIVKREKHVDIS